LCGSEGTYSVDALGIVTFIPMLNYYGTATPINYTIKDNLGMISNIGTINITVAAVNEIPLATLTNSNGIVNDGEPKSVFELTGMDIDGTIVAFTINNLPSTAQGVLLINGVPVIMNQLLDSLDVSKIKFLPAAGFIGTAEFVYTVTDNESAVSKPSTVTIEVVACELKNLIINDGVICVDYTTGELISPFTLISGLDPAVFDFQWFLNGTVLGKEGFFVALEEGVYTLIITKKMPNTVIDCGYKPTTIRVGKTSSAKATITVKDAFEDTIDIIVNIITGYGVYEYQMNGGSFQTDNVFRNVDSGTHFIIVNDTKGGCRTISLMTKVLKYPKIFRPNRDGYHDNWNI
jgi:hypothetical protein